MAEPYKMIYVNVLSLILIGLFFLIYKYVYPKKKIPYLLAFLILSIPPILSIFRFGTYESGDLSVHAKYAMDFFKNIIEWSLIPQWASINCNLYGCPNFLYMYPFPYYSISILHLIGISYIMSIKIYLTTTFILSGLFMYLWIKDQINERAGFISAIFYLYAPYHLVDMHFRVTIAEMASFMLLPISFLATQRFYKTKHIKWLGLLTLSISLLVLSHQAIITVAVPIFLTFGILLSNNKIFSKSYFYFFSSIVLGFLLTAYYWVPIIFEKSNILYGSAAKIFFPTVQDFIFSPWRYGLLLQGPEGQLSFIVGYIHLLVLLTSIIIYKKFGFGKLNSIFLLFIITFFIIFAMMQSFSKVLWDILPLIKNFQFSYRLLVIVALCTSVIAGITSIKIKSQKIYLLIIFTAIVLTILNWGNRRVIPVINDEYLYNEFRAGSPGLGDLTTPVAVDLEDSKKYPIRNSRIDILDGTVNIKQIDARSVYQTYVINVERDSLLRINTFYYPGWRVTSNNNNQNIDTNYNNSEGLMIIKLPKGLHFVEVKFLNTEIRELSLLISKISVLITIILITFFLLKRVK